jgi:hypothetical protein
MTQLKFNTGSEFMIAKDDTYSTPRSTKKGRHPADTGPVLFGFEHVCPAVVRPTWRTLDRTPCPVPPYRDLQAQLPR